MGVNSTKVHGAQAILVAMKKEWDELFNVEYYEDLNPYGEVSAGLHDVIENMSYVLKDLATQESAIVEEPIERGE